LRRALVTGAARGIGAAIAARLLADGFDVLTADRDQGCDLRFDVARGEIPELDDVDVCVSNAAITDTIAPAHRMTSEQWEQDIAVNLSGAFRVVQACLPGMRERRWGRIVVISSGAARDGLPGQVAYSASKAGTIGLVKTVAAENARRGITANAVLPGLIATERVREMPREVLDRVDAMLPAGRMGSAQEVAALVAFLASEEAGYISGEAIGIDGCAGLNTMSLGSERESADA
jgi:NAD(P)-dependent dehydrogenase (short-subunit alcohol dehydrogenase family)